MTALQAATCPVCSIRFYYPKTGYRPMTCNSFDCAYKYAHKGGVILEAKEVAKFRKKLKLTQKELAAEVGVTSQTVANWEQGLANPDRRSRKALDELKRRK